MSDEVTKFKKSKRIAKTDAVIKRQTRIAKSLGVIHSHNQPHRYAKHHALDCGNPKCQVCHSEKIFNKPTMQEKRFAESCKTDNQNS
jgi:hypothetical protein